MTEEKHRQTPRKEKETEQDKPDVIEEGEDEKEKTRAACCPSGPANMR